MDGRHPAAREGDRAQNPAYMADSSAGPFSPGSGALGPLRSVSAPRAAG